MIVQEERFLFPIYPLFCLSASVALVLLPVSPLPSFFSSLFLTPSSLPPLPLSPLSLLLLSPLSPLPLPPASQWWVPLTAGCGRSSAQICSCSTSHDHLLSQPPELGPLHDRPPLYPPLLLQNTGPVQGSVASVERVCCFLDDTIPCRLSRPPQCVHAAGVLGAADGGPAHLHGH